MIDDPLNRTKVKRGSELPWAKLTEDDVRLINELIAERNKLKAQLSALTNRAIAEKFGVHIRTIDSITGGWAWTHVN